MFGQLNLSLSPFTLQNETLNWLSFKLSTVLLRTSVWFLIKVADGQASGMVVKEAILNSQGFNIYVNFWYFPCETVHSVFCSYPKGRIAESRLCGVTVFFLNWCDKNSLHFNFIFLTWSFIASLESLKSGHLLLFMREKSVPFFHFCLKNLWIIPSL